MSHNPPVVNPRFTEDMRKRFEEAGERVMKSPTLSPILQGRNPEDVIIDELSVDPPFHPRILNQDQIDSLLGFDTNKKDKPKRTIINALKELHKGISSLAGRRAWKGKNLYLSDGKILISQWDRVKRETIWTQEEWVPTREDLMATDWETGD